MIYNLSMLVKKMDSSGSLYFGIRKIAPQKTASWKLPPMKALPCENYPPIIFPPRKLPPVKIPPPWETYPQWNALPTYKSHKWKKKQNYKIFFLEESCPIQHPYQNNQGLLWYTHDLTENTGLSYFLYRMKKI